MHSLAITEQGIAVRSEGDSLLLERGGSVIKQVRVREIDQVLVFGRVEISSGAIALLLRRGVEVVLMTQQAVFRGRLMGRASKNVLLRLAQYRRCVDPEFSVQVARSVVAGKIRHQRQILLRAQRRAQDEQLATAIGSLRLLTERAATSTSVDTLRGLEGQAAALYFGQFGKLIRNEEFEFSGRNRQPPRDPVNALLSFGYAVVGSLLESDAYRCGLDPMLGFLHEPTFGRSSLTLDLLEEFRPLVDSLVLRLLNRRQLGPQDFERRTQASLAEVLNPESEDAESPDSLDSSFIDEPDGSVRQVDDSSRASQLPVPNAPAGSAAVGREPIIGVYLADMGRRIFLNELFRRLRETQFYPPRQAAFELRDIFREQMYHLSRVIEGRDPAYIPFVPD